MDLLFLDENDPRRNIFDIESFTMEFLLSFPLYVSPENLLELLKERYITCNIREQKKMIIDFLYKWCEEAKEDFTGDFNSYIL